MTELFDRSELEILPLSQRRSKTDLSVMIDPNSTPPQVSEEESSRLEEIANLVKSSRKKKAPIIFAFGAHLVKNGLSRIMINLMKMGCVQHILGNGAVSIHDWEFAFLGETEEDVEKYLTVGQFGLWDETGKYINQAIRENRRLGYGSGLGKFIMDGMLQKEYLQHKHKAVSILGNAFYHGIPVSISSQIGCDIIHTHPNCDYAEIGEASGIDFLKFVDTISNLEGGTYISISSAITSPMVFEKALSMARNTARQRNKSIKNFNVIVNDIQKGTEDWSQGEPKKDNHTYYLRWIKSFSRAGGNLQYFRMDNRAFLHNLYEKLK